MTLTKSKISGIIGTVVVHLLLTVYLFLFGFEKPVPKSEEGLAVNFGNIDEAAGLFEPAGETTTNDAESVPEPAVEKATTENEMLSQSHEKSVSLENREKKTTEQTKTRQEQDIQKEQERKATTIRNQAASAFGTKTGTGKSQGSSSSGKGNQGVPNGNPNASGTVGSTGSGHFSLNGRTLNGGLPHPSYAIQEEGTVVVQIRVNPSGSVVSASISLQGTNTDNSTLRNAALNAARQARFNTIEGNQNQSGTITYRFRLK